MKLVPMLLLAVLLFGAKAVQAQPGPETWQVYGFYFKVPPQCHSITTLTEFPGRSKAPFVVSQHFSGDSLNKVWHMALHYYVHDSHTPEDAIIKEVLEDERPIRLYIKLGNATDYCCYYILRGGLPKTNVIDKDVGYGYIGEARPGTRTLLCFPALPDVIPEVRWDSIHPTMKTFGLPVGSLPDFRPFLRAVPPEYDDRTSAAAYCSPEWQRPAMSSAKKIRPRHSREKDGITTYDPYAPKAVPKPKRPRK